MPKYTAKLPLLEDKAHAGFEHIGDVLELVKQNLKMIVLTNPGERMMNTDFGVGIRGLLFENFEDDEVLDKYVGRIKNQVDRYLPIVEVEDIEIVASPNDNKLELKLYYSVEDYNGIQQLTVD